jgi:hypothetical protein
MQYQHRWAAFVIWCTAWPAVYFVYPLSPWLLLPVIAIQLYAPQMTTFHASMQRLKDLDELAMQQTAGLDYRSAIIGYMRQFLAKKYISRLRLRLLNMGLSEEQAQKALADSNQHVNS